MACFKTKKDVAFVSLLIPFLLGFIYLVFWQSTWWILSAPLYGMLSIAVALFAVDMRPMPRANVGTDVQTCILTAGEEKKSCTLVICKDYLAVETRAGLAQIHQDGQQKASRKSSRIFEPRLQRGYGCLWPPLLTCCFSR